MNTDEGFLNWFAGLVDGEGCFHIARVSGRNGRPYVQFLLQIALRDDDRSILEEIQSTLGMGDITWHPRQVGPSHNGNPLVTLRIVRIRDVQRLAVLLQGRLHTKKRHDFDLWCAALEAKAAGATTETLLSYKAALQALRVYPVDPDRMEKPTHPQLRMIEALS